MRCRVTTRHDDKTDRLDHSLWHETGRAKPARTASRNGHTSTATVQPGAAWLIRSGRSATPLPSALPLWVGVGGLVVGCRSNAGARHPLPSELAKVAEGLYPPVESSPDRPRYHARTAAPRHRGGTGRAQIPAHRDRDHLPREPTPSRCERQRRSLRSHPSSVVPRRWNTRW
jgi:hypothetical protein